MTGSTVHSADDPAGAVTRERTACNLCGGEEFIAVYRGCPDRRHWLPGAFDVVRCRGCGLIQTNPRPDRESVRAYYPTSYVAFSSGQDPNPSRLYRGLREMVRLPHRLRYGSSSVLPRPATGSNRLLDIGCGGGTLLGEMSRLGWDVWGIEPDAGLARSVATRLSLSDDRIFAGTAEAADFPSGWFDLVTMSHVLEHLHDPASVLCKVYQWLRPGGLLRIWVPNIDSFESRAFGRWWFGLDIPRHLYHYNPSTLRRLLARCGFQVERLVPQFQGSSLSGSLTHVADAALRRHQVYRQSRTLYYLSLPIASVLLPLGNFASLDVTARRSERWA